MLMPCAMHDMLVSVSSCWRRGPVQAFFEIDSHAPMLPGETLDVRTKLSNYWSGCRHS